MISRPPLWAWVPSDSEWPEPHMGRVVPRMPRNRPLFPARTAQPRPAKTAAVRLVDAPAAAGPLKPARRDAASSSLRGALVGAAIALLGVLAVHLWSV